MRRRILHLRFPRSEGRGSIEARSTSQLSSGTAAFPRSEGRGSIEAPVNASTGVRCSAGFHVRKDVAPLKRRNGIGDNAAAA